MNRRVLLVGGPKHGEVAVLDDRVDYFVRYLYAEREPAEETRAHEPVVYKAMRWGDSTDRAKMLMLDLFVTEEVGGMSPDLQCRAAMSALLRFVHSEHPESLTIIERDGTRPAALPLWRCNRGDSRGHEPHEWVYSPTGTRYHCDGVFETRPPNDVKGLIQYGEMDPEYLRG